MRAGARSAPPACLVARPSSAASAAADAVPLRLQINSVGPSRPIGPVAARRPVRAAGTTRPGKQAIGSCLGRQCGTAPDTARHEESIGPHSAGPLSAGPFRARAGRPVWNSIAAGELRGSSTAGRGRQGGGGEAEERKKKTEGIIVTQDIVGLCPHLKMAFLRSRLA
jgi:hypothetical protein